MPYFCYSSYTVGTVFKIAIPLESLNHFKALYINSDQCPTSFKEVLLGLRQFLASENPLKMMKKAFYFTSKALFILQIFKFFS